MSSVSSVFPEPQIRINPPDYRLWDFAGVDGLQVAIKLFSSSVSYLAPYQSLTSECNRQPCSVLRLCEHNFRVALPEQENFEQAIARLELDVWVKTSPTANLLMSADSGLARLAQLATTKPFFTLDPFPLNRAVPARIHGVAILAWHHLWQAQPRVLIQTAAADFEFIQRQLGEHQVVTQAEA